MTFAKDTLDRRFLEANLRSLCQEIGEELRRQDKQARCVVIRLRYADFKTITRQVTLTEASTAQVIFARALQLLNKALSQEQRPVRLIGVRASNLTGKERQLGMFDPEIEKRKHLDMAIDQIRRKYGSAAIKTGKTYIASLFGEILNSK